MSSNDAAMDAALLEIAKDLLQTSDDLASTDPSSSAKLAREAYEIGRSLGIVRDYADDEPELADGLEVSGLEDSMSSFDRSETAPAHHSGPVHQSDDVEDASDADLLRILDRQKSILPNSAKQLAPVQKSGRGTGEMAFDQESPRRSGWFGWMRSREWRHAG